MSGSMESRRRLVVFVDVSATNDRARKKIQSPGKQAKDLPREVPVIAKSERIHQLVMRKKDQMAYK